MLQKSINLDDLAVIHDVMYHCFISDGACLKTMEMLWEHSKLLTVARFLVSKVFSEDLITIIDLWGFNDTEVRDRMILEILASIDKVRAVLQKYQA